MARYAIGDVHGCLATLRALFEDRLAVSKSDLVVLLGDYVDRGPESRGVLDYVRTLQEEYNVVTLRGNHDDMLVRGRFSTYWSRVHRSNGGLTALWSFGIEDHRDIPLEYCDMIDLMPLYHVTDEYAFVHGSLNMKLDDPYADLEAMLWERRDDDDVDHEGRRVVCGHTPTRLDVIRERIDYGSKVILDNGCVYAGRPDMGNLVALDLDRLVLHVQENIDGQP